MNIFSRSIYFAASVLTSFSAAAFSVDSYAPASVLNEGKWVKISVSETGMHAIPVSTLKNWGFNDPAKVRIHGYGGAALDDVLDPEGYIDDLPVVAAELTAKGLTFYAVGPMQETMLADGSYGHAVNPYSNYGYYFLTESAQGSPTPSAGGTALTSDAGCETTAMQMLVHEKDLVSLGATGRMLVGEDFNQTRTQKFKFALPGKVEGTDVTLQSSFVACTVTSASELHFIANGTQLAASPSDRINLTGNRSGYWGVQGLTTKKFPLTGQNLDLTLTFINTGMVKTANLDYLEVIYEREIVSGMEFFATSPQVSAKLGADSRVWDVTDAVNVRRMNVGADGAWRNDMPGVRRYAIWSDTDALPSPKKEGDVRNQNLHGLERVPDMVIVAPEAYLSVAHRIAEIHHNYPLDTLKVEVVSLETVLNEFGSGAFDPGAVRRYFKMLYDRGNEAETPLHYALMIGKGTCDNRRLTQVGRLVSNPMPLWVSEASLQENLSYSSDDYFALLDDFDGQRPQRETLDIAVGRIPVTSLAEANVAADKIEQYLYSMPNDDWRARVTILADDENQGQHMEQSEKLVANLAAGVSGSRLVVDKVYCDAYTRQNSTYPAARADLFKDFAAGTSVFMFIGHGSPTALGSKIIIGPNDFRNEFFLRKLPFFYAATCSFLHWDSDITSMAETLMFQSDGGMIGCISALRPVYITNNGNLSAAFGLTLGEFDETGSVPTIGELYRLSKNRVTNDTNKLRYVLMGDPALRPSIPSALVHLESINGKAVDADNPATVKGRERLEISGSITDSRGNAMPDFNGTVIATLYDAEYSTTSHGYGEGKEVTFEQTGKMLFTARGVAKNGRFTIKVQMPGELADNWRPATLSLYASSGSDLRQAAGVSRNIYAFGYDETTPLDSIPPVIHTAVLNGDAFENGQKVNPNPVLIATISDNIGLNLSSAGVGNRMSVAIDGRETDFEAANYFVPDSEPKHGAVSGTLTYQIENLADGDHQLRLRVWDLDNNFTDAFIDCKVVSDLAPEVYEVYTSAGPARDKAQFYVRHNRPDQVLNVTVNVYNLMGTLVWSGTSNGRSNGGVSTPVVWDLKNLDGTRVSRGIYVYRAEVSTEGSTTTTASRKLAVANQ